MSKTYSGTLASGSMFDDPINEKMFSDEFESDIRFTKFHTVSSQIVSRITELIQEAQPLLGWPTVLPQS